MRDGDWISETVHEETGFRVSLRADRVLVSERTGMQDLQVFENGQFGRVMVLDGAIQLTTADEFVYHEMIAHVPLLAHGGVRRVLVIGGGDGGVLREVMAHGAVEAVTLVEIDRAVVDFARTHFPGVSAGAFEDPRLSLVIADGARYVAGTDARYDVIIVDSTDPVGPSAALFTASFYRDCRRCLAPGGLVATQAGVPFVQAREFAASIGNLRAAFAGAGAFLSTVPTYVGGAMAHGLAADGWDPAAVPVDTLGTRFAAADLSTRYYTPAVHRAAFALPGYVAALLA